MRRVLLLTSLVLALAVLAAPATASAACPWANSRPSTLTHNQVVYATICLINSERTRRGLRALSENPRLDFAATGHAVDMVRRHYFSHTSPEGTTFVDRIRASGYLSGARWWTVGENIAWGAGTSATPSAIFNAWMNSPGHRANILSRSFRDTGIGVALGSPTGYRDAATYVNTFGARS